MPRILEWTPQTPFFKPAEWVSSIPWKIGGRPLYFDLMSLFVRHFLNQREENCLVISRGVWKI